MYLRLLAGVLSVGALCSCSTITHTASTADVDTRVYNVTVADMKVSDNRASKTLSWDWAASLGSDAGHKETVTAELLREADADVLVEPQFIVNKRGLFRGSSVTVTGYPATYSNFRPMTQADADIIATLEGRVAPPPGAAPARPAPGGTYPVIATNRPRKVSSASTVEVGRRSFLSLVGGPIIDGGGDDRSFNTGPSLGLMFGSYGKSWGWYGKVLWTHADADCTESYYVPYNYSYHYGGYMSYRPTKEYCNGFMLTFGAIKTITRNFNVLAGVGFGLGFHATNWDLKNHPAVPFEAGVQWTPRKMSLTAGCTAMPAFGEGSTVWNIAPFVGIGFSI